MSTRMGGRDDAADRAGGARAGYRLDRAVADIYGDLRLDPVLDHLLSQTTRITGSPFGAVSVVDAAAGRYTKAAEHGIACQVGSSFPLDEGATGRAFAMRRPIVVADYAELSGGHLPKAGPSMHRAAVAVPVWWRDDVIAVNVAFLDPGAGCTVEVVDDIEALSQTASSAILSSGRRDPTLAGALLRRIRERGAVATVTEAGRPVLRSDAVIGAAADVVLAVDAAHPVDGELHVALIHHPDGVRLLVQRPLLGGATTPALLTALRGALAGRVDGLVSVEEVAGWGLAVHADLREPRSAPPPVRTGSPLTPREREVLTLVRRGGSDREIAGRLGVSPKTVEKHVGALLRKTGSPNRTAAVAAAAAFGWSDPD